MSKIQRKTEQYSGKRNNTEGIESIQKVNGLIQREIQYKGKMKTMQREMKQYRGKMEH